MQQPLPVIIEDLIRKVTDTSTHPEQRQHYATTLKNIVDEGSKAYKQWESQRLGRK